MIDTVCLWWGRMSLGTIAVLGGSVTLYLFANYVLTHLRVWPKIARGLVHAGADHDCRECTKKGIDKLKFGEERDE